MQDYRMFCSVLTLAHVHQRYGYLAGNLKDVGLTGHLCTVIRPSEDSCTSEVFTVLL